MLSKVISYAIEAHHNTNHLYDKKPYSVHLAMVVSFAYKYIHLIPKEFKDDIIEACWLHDTIEDARKTYNDILKISNKNVADIVYAVTNEKGKNRSERANQKYYNGIVEQGFRAIFVKLCDRLANVQYSKDVNSRMIEVYRNENEHFLESILQKEEDKIMCCDMVNELKSIVKVIEYEQ